MIATIGTRFGPVDLVVADGGTVDVQADGVDRPVLVDGIAYRLEATVAHAAGAWVVTRFSILKAGSLRSGDFAWSAFDEVKCELPMAVETWARTFEGTATLFEAVVVDHHERLGRARRRVEAARAELAAATAELVAFTTEGPGMLGL